MFSALAPSKKKLRPSHAHSIKLCIKRKTLVRVSMKLKVFHFFNMIDSFDYIFIPTHHATENKTPTVGIFLIIICSYICKGE